MTILPHVKPPNPKRSDREVDRRSGFYDHLPEEDEAPLPSRRPTSSPRRRRAAGGRRPRGRWDVLASTSESRSGRRADGSITVT